MQHSIFIHKEEFDTTQLEQGQENCRLCCGQQAAIRWLLAAGEKERRVRTGQDRTGQEGKASLPGRAIQYNRTV